MANQRLVLCMFLCTIVFVCFNKVYTVQYFVWYLTLAPLVVPMLSRGRLMLGVTVCWVLCVATWLYFAYGLEFLGVNTYVSIWLSSCALFTASIAFVIGVLYATPY